MELSLVILIVSILIAGSLSVSMSSIDKARHRESEKRINAIYKAMGSYLLANKALPCPASLLNVKNDSSYGLAGLSGDCNNIAGVYEGSSGNSAELVYGMVPIRTLGLPIEMAEDGFGSKFTYVVSKEFTNPDTSSTDGFGTVDVASIDFSSGSAVSGFISIKEKISGLNFYNDTNSAIFTIISHGRNKYGAVGANSSNKNSSSGSDSLEQENFINGSLTSGINQTANFYGNNYFVASAIDNEVFDDILFYKTRDQILVDFEALNLIYCPAIVNESYDRCVSSLCNWNKATYNQIAPSTTDCSATYDTTVVKPTKRCGAFGVWEEGYINPCTE